MRTSADHLAVVSGMSEFFAIRVWRHLGPQDKSSGHVDLLKITAISLFTLKPNGTN